MEVAVLVEATSCIYGCRDERDRLKRYVACLFLWRAVRRALGVAVAEAVVAAAGAAASAVAFAVALLLLRDGFFQP